jgi:hypothetical protein
MRMIKTRFGVGVDISRSELRPLTGQLLKITDVDHQIVQGRLTRWYGTVSDEMAMLADSPVIQQRSLSCFLSVTPN